MVACSQPRCARPAATSSTARASTERSSTAALFEFLDVLEIPIEPAARLAAEAVERAVLSETVASAAHLDAQDDTRAGLVAHGARHPLVRPWRGGAPDNND